MDGITSPKAKDKYIYNQCGKYSARQKGSLGIVYTMASNRFEVQSRRGPTELVAGGSPFDKLTLTFSRRRDL